MVGVHRAGADCALGLPRAGPHLLGQAVQKLSPPDHIPSHGFSCKVIKLLCFLFKCLPHPIKCSEFSMSKFENRHKTFSLKSLDILHCPATDISSPPASLPIPSRTFRKFPGFIQNRDNTWRLNKTRIYFRIRSCLAGTSSPCGTNVLSSFAVTSPP